MTGAARKRALAAGRFWVFSRPILGWIPILFLLSCQSAPIAPQTDWADVTLRATGTGLIQGPWTAPERIEAVQRAKRDAYAKLESQILALKTESNKSIQEMAMKDAQVQRKISAFVKGAKILRTENTSQGIEIQTELFLGENFKATLGLVERKPASSSPSSPNSMDKSQGGFSR